MKIKGLFLVFAFLISNKAYQQCISTLDIPAPDSIRLICDKLFLSEMGKELFKTCIKFEKAEGIKRIYKDGESRVDYTVHYSFSYPDVKESTMELKMNYMFYSGKGHLQSSRFLRLDKTDLPKNFKKQGAKIIDFQKAKSIAFETDSLLKQNGAKAKGDFVLYQDSFYWCFSYWQTEANPHGDAENAIEHSVIVDPYSGKVVTKRGR